MEIFEQITHNFCEISFVLVQWRLPIYAESLASKHKIHNLTFKQKPFPLQAMRIGRIFCLENQFNQNSIFIPYHSTFQHHFVAILICWTIYRKLLKWNKIITFYLLDCIVCVAALSLISTISSSMTFQCLYDCSAKVSGSMEALWYLKWKKKWPFTICTVRRDEREFYD